MAQTRIPCLLMRGGTSKGAYFLAQDLPDQPERRDRVLLAAMGSPDARQIDGIGGGDSLTSKVAIIRKSARAEADVDYLFAQVIVDEPRVDYGQNCGNILAGVGPFAIERGLVAVTGEVTAVRIFMENTGQIAVAHVPTFDGGVRYGGDARIDGVPGQAAPLIVEFELPPPGPNSNTTLTLGIRVFGVDDAASAAVATTLTDSNLRAELKLVRLGVGNEVPIPLTRREYRGHDASEIVPVGADGRVPHVVRTSIDTTAVEEAGIPSRASSSRVLAFAWAPDTVPGTYRLELKLIAPDPELASIESELLLAYQHRSK